MRLRARIACLAVGLVLVSCTVIVPGADRSTAAFTDAEHAAAQVQAAEVPAPVGNGCQLSPLPPLASTSATLRWQAPSSAPATYVYEWQRVSTSGAVLSSGTYPPTTTEHQVAASAIGIATTQTFQVRVVEGDWHSPWLNGRVTTLLDLLGVALIGSCSWQ